MIQPWLRKKEGVKEQDGTKLRRKESADQTSTVTWMSWRTSRQARTTEPRKFSGRVLATLI